MFRSDAWKESPGKKKQSRCAYGTDLITSTSKSRQRSPASLGPAKPRFLLEIPRQLLDVAKNRLPATQRRLNGVLVLAHPEVLDLFG